MMFPPPRVCLLRALGARGRGWSSRAGALRLSGEKIARSAGPLRLTSDAGAQQTTLAVDVNGDGLADFALLIAGEHLSAAGWAL